MHGCASMHLNIAVIALGPETACFWQKACFLLETSVFHPKSASFPKKPAFSAEIHAFLSQNRVCYIYIYIYYIAYTCYTLYASCIPYPAICICYMHLTYFNEAVYALQFMHRFTSYVLCIRYPIMYTCYMYCVYIPSCIHTICIVYTETCIIYMLHAHTIYICHISRRQWMHRYTVLFCCIYIICIVYAISIVCLHAICIVCILYSITYTHSR